MAAICVSKELLAPEVGLVVLPEVSGTSTLLSLGKENTPEPVPVESGMHGPTFLLLEADAYAELATEFGRTFVSSDGGAMLFCSTPAVLSLVQIRRRTPVRKQGRSVRVILRYDGRGGRATNCA